MVVKDFHGIFHRFETEQEKDERRFHHELVKPRELVVWGPVVLGF